MTLPSPAGPVKLFLLTLHRDPEILEKAVSLVKTEFGGTDYVSEDYPFQVTNYYAREMGEGLLRRFYSFERLILPDQIVEAKLFTNQVEQKFLDDSQRRINLDFGYLDYYKVVLASAKFGGQKVYLRNGIYADLTLVFYKKKWESFEWSFPDFNSGMYDTVLSRIRDLYKAQVRSSSLEDGR